MDNQEKQKSNKTLAEQYNDLVVQLNSVKSTLKTILGANGTSYDSRELALSYQRESNTLHNLIASIWTPLQGNARANQVGSEFSDSEATLKVLSENVTRLFADTNIENNFSSKLSANTAIDRAEFEKALQHHTTQSRFTLRIFGLASVCSISLIIVFFIAFPSCSSPTQERNIGQVLTTQGIANSNPEKALSNSTQWQDSVAWWSKLILNFGGKFALLFALAWMLKFTGELHSRHVAQSIIYRDRLTALSTIDVITIGANTQTREQILLKMSETYLNLENNAFINREKEKAPSEEVFTKKELIGLLKEVAGVIKNNKSN